MYVCTQSQHTIQNHTLTLAFSDTPKQTRASRLVGCYAMEFVGTFLLTLTVALSLCEDNCPPAPATAGLMLSALVRLPCDATHTQWERGERRASSCSITSASPPTQTGLYMRLPIRRPLERERDFGCPAVPAPDQGAAQGGWIRDYAGATETQDACDAMQRNASCHASSPRTGN